MSFNEKIYSWCEPLLQKAHMPDLWASYLSLAFNLCILFAVALGIFRLCRLSLVSLAVMWARRTKTRFDDFLVTNKTVKYVAYLIPLVYVYKSVPVILKNYVYWEGLFGKMVGIYIVLLVMWITRSVLYSCRDYLKTKARYADKPIDSYVQVIMIVLWVFGVVVIISEIFDISKETLFGTLGAVSAVILLIFRDTLLGFVASVQVSLNDMVRIGDWITFDKYGADGDVIEINLATVKVRNFDHTTTTIPTYSLISDSFRNWRGMLDSPGRRIKRAIYILPSSVRFLQEPEVDKLKQIERLRPYLEHRQKEVNTYNDKHQIDKHLPINGRNLTNFGVFRKYVNVYLEQYPGIHPDLIVLCRQLAPTPQGIPLEIYCFSTDKRFENYEYIMSDIFDHIIAAVPYFDLKLVEGRPQENTL